MRPRAFTILVPVSLCFSASVVAAQCELNQLTPSDGEFVHQFGSSLAKSGDTLFVSENVQGAVYVFERAARGWVEAQKLPVGTSPSALVTAPVAASGETLFAGAPFESSAAGAVYVFEHSAFGWSRSQVLVASDGGDQDKFGFDLAVDGDTALVGAPRTGVPGPGAVYVFQRSGGQWTEVQKIVSPVTGDNDGFGVTVDLAGDTAVVGAPGFEGGDGTAFAYERTPLGWSLTATLLATEPDEPQFGVSVATDGARIVVGQKGNGFGSQEFAYVYARTLTTGWSLEQKLEQNDTDSFDAEAFGHSVSIDGDTILVGGISIFFASGQGFAYRFQLTPSGWSQTAKLQPDAPKPLGDFGWSVLLDGDEAFVSEPTVPGLDTGPGSVFVYELPSTSVPYCFCDTSAPCGNEDPLGGCASSVGSGALLAACGSTSIAADDLVLTAVNVPSAQSGIVFMGAGTQSTPLGDGTLCVSPGHLGTFRFRVQSTGSGAFAEGPGIVAFTESQFAPSGAIIAGQTWNFQAWFRDPAGPCGEHIGLSNALAVTFGP